jgi:hypothetical protein
VSKPKYISISIAEFLADIAGEVDLAELGAYWLVCLLIYSRADAIKDDPEWISGKLRKVNPRTVRAAIDGLVRMGKVTRIDGELMVNRCRTEIERTTNRIRTASENGSNGGRPSKKTTTSETEALIYEKTIVKVNEGKGEEEEPVANAIVVRSAPKSSSIDESEFQEFYNVFPLHKARGGALKAYLSARKKGASHEILVRGAASYADHCRRTGTTKQFTAHPATWLNEQRWLDDLSDDQPACARPGRPTGGYRQGGRSDVEIIADLVAEAERQEQGGGLRLGDDDDGFFGGLRVVS